MSIRENIDLNTITVTAIVELAMQKNCQILAGGFTAEREGMFCYCPLHLLARERGLTSQSPSDIQEVLGLSQPAFEGFMSGFDSPSFGTYESFSYKTLIYEYEKEEFRKAHRIGITLRFAIEDQFPALLYDAARGG